MITLNISAILNEREIKNHYTYLCKNGFIAHTASRMLNHKTKSISFDQLEKLCTLLHCTPNDILCWQPNEGTQPNNNQPLHQLTAPKHKTIIEQSFKSLPLEKLREIRKIIEQEITKPTSEKQELVEGRK